MVDLAIAVPLDDLSSLELVQLHAQYRDLQQAATQRDLTDDELFRACAILRALRRKSSGPPKAGPTRKRIADSIVPATATDL